MNIHLILYAYALAEPLYEAFAAANDPTITWHLFLHSQRPDVVAVSDQLAEQPNVRYYPYGYGRGLARSCNEGILNALSEGADVIGQLCDDMLACPVDLRRMADYLLDTPSAAAVEGNCYVELTRTYRTSGFDIALFSPLALAAIGLFDQNCWPINYEDMDWKRRAQLAGYSIPVLPDTQFIHRDLNEPHNTPTFLEHFHKTQAYYEAKWGGDLEHETFTRPFNDPRYDLRIEAAQRDNPYPDYQRKDLPV